MNSEFNVVNERNYRHMKFNTFFILVYLFCCSCSNTTDTFTYKIGDLLFQDIDCGPFCNAIKKVTWGVDGKDFAHVAMVVSTKDTVKVVEAVGEGVIITNLNDFLAKSSNKMGRPKVVVGRVKKQYHNLIPNAIEFSMSKLGASYDDIFDINNDLYYCSELVYYSFMNDKKESIFQLEPMTFNDPETGLIFPIWQKYFNELQVKVPEGEPGLNPGSISRSDKIEIVHSYY